MLNTQIQNAYPQALAKLITLFGNIDSAEEYLQTAVEQALIKWPNNQPENTVAWLVQVAKNKYIDHYRRQKKQTSLENITESSQEIDLSEQALLQSYNDDLLRLIFTCCHPSLNLETQITLALKHVLGLDIGQIASALVIKKATLEQRLLRAKKKIITNNIQYQIPESKHLPERLSGVLTTVYLLFNEGYLTTEDHNFIRSTLCREAIRLARLIQSIIKNQPEVIGLLALLLHQEARTPARIDQSGNMILLSEQDRSLWRKTYIQEANSLVEKALLLGKGSPYAIQAAIAALHNNAKRYQDTDWQQIYQLYLVLIKHDDNPILQLNAAIALAQTGQRKQSIQQVINLHPKLINYRHYYTALAGLYFEDKDYLNAQEQYLIALKYTTSPSEQKFIQQRLRQLEQSVVIIDT